MTTISVCLLLTIGMLLAFQQTTAVDLPAKFGQSLGMEEKIHSKRASELPDHIMIANRPCGGEDGEAPFVCKDTGDIKTGCSENFGICETGICCFKNAVAMNYKG